jgi:hypothetical protein
MESSGDASFTKGAMVLVTLNTPREKFWGAVLDISPSGIAMRGIDLNSFEDFARLNERFENRTGQTFTALAATAAEMQAASSGSRKGD